MLIVQWPLLLNIQGMMVSMRLVSVDTVESGQALGKPILGAKGNILLQAGVSLTPSYIRRLKQMGVAYVFVQDSETYDIEVGETIAPEVQREAVTKIERVYHRMLDPSQNLKMIESGELGEQFNRVFKLMFQSLSKDRTFLMDLNTIYSSDSYLYTHCMNVGTMACILGMAHGFSEDRLKKFGLGAMLYDIGKLHVNEAILNKPGTLTEEERAEIERHCELGYNTLIKQPSVYTTSAHCALQHHEKFDGTGYPRRLKGTEIHEFGRILAVTDVYDALTSNRVYRKAILPHEAAEFLYAGSGTHFDPQFVQLFMKHINIFPNGLSVDLSNRTAGVVARPNPETLQRPVVLVLTEEGQKVTPYELDLSSELNVTIVGCKA